MAHHHRMSDPGRELTPKELLREIQDWAYTVNYSVEARIAASESTVVTVRDPAGGYTTTTIPKEHGGRRLRKDQVR